MTAGQSTTTGSTARYPYTGAALKAGKTYQWHARGKGPQEHIVRTEVVAPDVGCPPICMYCEFPIGEFPQVLTARFALYVDQTLLRKLYVCFRCSLTFRYTNREHQQRFLKKCRDADDYWRCWVALERLCQYAGAESQATAQIINYAKQGQNED